jgi:hypothetical protein
MVRTKIRFHPFSSNSSRCRSRSFSIPCANRAESEDLAEHFGLRGCRHHPKAVATMEGGQEEAYNQDDATDFIALNALRLRATARQGK